MATVQSRPSWQTQFLILSATWGSSFLFIKVLTKHWPALWVAFGRVSLGALALIVLTFARRERLQFERRVWLHLVIAAMLFNAIPFTLFAFGEKHVSSVVAGLWNATTPLWVMTFALAAFPEQHPSPARMLAMLTGFIGVAVLLGPWRGFGGGTLQGDLACAGAALCYGLGFLHTRRNLAGVAASGVALSAGQLLCATILLAAVVPFAGSPSSHLGLDGLGSLLALGILGSGLAYALNYAVVRAAGASVASTVTYLIPVYSTLLGVIVLGERLTWNQPVGAIVLLLGIAIAQGRIPALDFATRDAIQAGSGVVRTGAVRDGDGRPRP
jgi:drug/metabolite transporter (DMT)-like permease